MRRKEEEERKKKEDDAARREEFFRNRKIAEEARRKNEALMRGEPIDAPEEKAEPSRYPDEHEKPNFHYMPRGGGHRPQTAGDPRPSRSNNNALVGKA